jgi:hypothetical protein
MDHRLRTARTCWRCSAHGPWSHPPLEQSVVLALPMDDDPSKFGDEQAEAARAMRIEPTSAAAAAAEMSLRWQLHCD